jgi:hypothetical protein
MLAYFPTYSKNYEIDSSLKLDSINTSDVVQAKNSRPGPSRPKPWGPRLRPRPRPRPRRFGLEAKA